MCKQPDKFSQLKNVDGGSFNTCTEYRCKALGKACEYIDTLEGADCVNKNPGDLNSPVISPNFEVLEEQDFIIDDRGRDGFIITNILPAFKPIILAFKTDELSQCSYTLNAEEALKPFDQYSGTITTGLTEDHRLFIKYPLSDPRNVIETTYYIKCQDTHENSNEAPYTITFKVNNEPDVQPPNVLFVDGPLFIKNGETTTKITAFVDDAHTVGCKYAKEDVSYSSMPQENTMLCTDERPNGVNFYCHAELKELHSGENTFYIRCKDSEGIEMPEAFKYSIIGTESLEVAIGAGSPNGKIFYDDITLRVITQKGAQQGKARCEYSLNNGKFSLFKNTGDTEHSQDQVDLQKGHYSYSIRCGDVAGNEATTKIEFDVDADTDKPSLLHVYKEDGLLYVILNEATTCEARNEAFTFGTGIKMTANLPTVHSIPLEFQKYFINCIDAFNNQLQQMTIIP